MFVALFILISCRGLEVHGSAYEVCCMSCLRQCRRHRWPDRPGKQTKNLASCKITTMKKVTSQVSFLLPR